METDMRKIVFGLAIMLIAAMAPATAQAPALINANTATEQQIASVPGLAPLAATIVAKRPFANPSALDAVLAAGNIPPEQRKLIYTRFWAPMNLNTATSDDIMLIPGMSPRMMNEFREYRPYKSIGQFRYEIGKYVSRAEVARLEAYVYVPAR
jgi:DNA uptake protein ComE-like DNA-binding protein